MCPQNPVLTITREDQNNLLIWLDFKKCKIYIYFLRFKIKFKCESLIWNSAFTYSHMYVLLSCVNNQRHTRLAVSLCTCAKCGLDLSAPPTANRRRVFWGKFFFIIDDSVFFPRLNYHPGYSFTLWYFQPQIDIWPEMCKPDTIFLIVLNCKEVDVTIQRNSTRSSCEGLHLGDYSHRETLSGGPHCCAGNTVNRFCEVIRKPKLTKPGVNNCSLHTSLSL